MGEPTGIGSGAHEHQCAGNPHRPGAVLFDCPREAKWVVVATISINESGKPVIALVTACDSHVLGVKAWLRDRVFDFLGSQGRPFTEDDEPLVDSVNNLAKLNEHFGSTAWIASAG